jgi:hypothetical protein
MKTLYAEKSIATPFATDKFFDLPGHLASWVEKKGRKKVEVAEDGESWIFKVKMLTPEDLRVLVINRLDGISIQKNKLFVKVRK